MGWEMRRGKRVYYRKVRYRDAEGRSRVCSVYCGSGERGERAAREDEARRESQAYTPAIVAAGVLALREMAQSARGDKSFAPPLVRQVEPPRPAPMPMPVPAHAAPRRLRGLAAWRAMGRYELLKPR